MQILHLAAAANRDDPNVHITDASCLEYRRYDRRCYHGPILALALIRLVQMMRGIKRGVELRCDRWMRTPLFGLDFAEETRREAGRLATTGFAGLI